MRARHDRPEGAGSVAILAALPEESGPLLRRLTQRRRVPGGGVVMWRGALGGRGVIVCRTGAGSLAAGEGAATLFSRFAPSLWIGAGLAGALAPELPAGAVLVGDEVVDERGRLLSKLESGAVARLLASCSGAIHSRFVRVPSIASTPGEKADLLRALGEGPPAAADMESAAWAEAAKEAGGVPGVIVRTVSDAAAEEIPAFVAASVSPSGAIDRGRVARHAIRHPSSVGKLLALRRRARLCAERLAECLERFAERGF